MSPKSASQRLCRRQVPVRPLSVKPILNKRLGRSSEKLNPDQMELLFEELRAMQDALDEAEEKLEALESRPSRSGQRASLFGAYLGQEIRQA